MHGHTAHLERLTNIILGRGGRDSGNYVSRTERYLANATTIFWGVMKAMAFIYGVKMDRSSPSELGQS